MLPVYFLVILASQLLQTSYQSDEFEVVMEWQHVNFTWQSQQHYQDALSSKTYIPENVALAGIDIYENNVYFAIPRLRPGVPASVGFTPLTSQSELNPLITPFPNWDFNDQSSCDKLINVQCAHIDPTSGLMWILDGVRVNPFSLPGCPPKLMLFDLKSNNELVHVYEFPNSICPTVGGYLDDFVIDGAYAYITDISPTDPGLIVYSLDTDTSWKIRDGSMFPEVRASNFMVDGMNVNFLIPIDGIALSPDKESVYYCALTSVNLYSIQTKYLRNQTLMGTFNWRYLVNYEGQKQAQSDGIIMDNEGNLYYGLLPLSAVGKRNVCTNISTETIVAQQPDVMMYPDCFAFDTVGYLYLLADNLVKYFDPAYVFPDPDSVKIRVMKLYTGTKSYFYV